MRCWCDATNNKLHFTQEHISPPEYHWYWNHNTFFSKMYPLWIDSIFMRYACWNLWNKFILNTKLVDISMDDSVCEINWSKQKKALLKYLCVLLLIGCLTSIYPFIIYIYWFWEEIYCSLEVFHTNRTLDPSRVACFLHLHLTRSEMRMMVVDYNSNSKCNPIITKNYY